MQHIIPVPPPSWATRSAVEDGGVSHTAELGEVPTVPDGPDLPGAPMAVTLARYDQLDVLPEGLAVTPGQPEVLAGDHRLSVGAAAELAALVLAAVEAAQVSR